MHSEQTELLACAGRLLLEYNESTGEIHRALARAARILTSDKFHLAVTYSGIVVSLADEPPLMRRGHELRYNAALQTNIHSILDRVCRGEIKPDRALELLKQVEAETSKHSSWLVALVLG